MHIYCLDPQAYHIIQIRLIFSITNTLTGVVSDCSKSVIDLTFDCEKENFNQLMRITSVISFRSCFNRTLQKFQIKMADDYVPSKRSTFMYFAYGSNLWTNRIRLQNASAVRKGIAELKVSSQNRS